MINIIRYRIYEKIFFGNARKALNHKKKNFSLNDYFWELEKKKKIKIIRNFKVEKIVEKKNNIEILSKRRSLYCKKLFIACGPVSTAKIILNSFKKLKFINIKETSMISSLWYALDKINNYESKRICDYFLTSVSRTIFSSQIYILKKNIIKKILKKNKFFQKFVFLKKMIIL